MPEARRLQLTAPLTVCVDVKQAASYLALGPTYRLVDELGVEVDWLPIDVPPLLPPSEPSADDDRGARHRRFRAQYLERDLMRYGEVQGLELRGPHRNPDSSLAGITLLWVKRHSPLRVRAYLEAVFARYWERALDLENPVAMCHLLGDIDAAYDGFDRFHAGAGRAEYEYLQSTLHGSGVFAAPAYLAGEELFIGRQHLPMIRYLLTGRADPPPI